MPRQKTPPEAESPEAEFAALEPPEPEEPESPPEGPKFAPAVSPGLSDDALAAAVRDGGAEGVARALVAAVPGLDDVARSRLGVAVASCTLLRQVIHPFATYQGGVGAPDHAAMMAPVADAALAASVVHATLIHCGRWMEAHPGRVVREVIRDRDRLRRVFD